MEWIEDTVTLPQYHRNRNTIFPASPPAGVTRALSIAHPLVFQKATHTLIGAISSKFIITPWKANCEANRISLGTLIFAARPFPTFSYVTCDLISIGPFLALLRCNEMYFKLLYHHEFFAFAAM